VLSNDIPHNQHVLAQTFKAIARGRPKSLKQHLIDAELLMSELRERGIRLVPFPALKTRSKKTSRKFR
jgi:hypothetical protein